MASTQLHFRVKGTWNVQKGNLKEKFPILTDRDLQFEEGKKEEMLESLRLKLGKTKEEFKEIMASV